MKDDTTNLVPVEQEPLSEDDKKVLWDIFAEVKKERAVDLLREFTDPNEALYYDYYDCGSDAIACHHCYGQLVKNDRRHKDGVDVLPARDKTQHGK